MAAHTTEVGTLTTPDNFQLYTKTWLPTSSPLKARVVFIHGFDDHCNWYDPLFPLFAQQGIKTYSFDQRGWGKSVHEPHQKGASGPTSQVMDDITSFVKGILAHEEERDVPLFLMGHSMGGAEVLVYAATGPKEVLSRIRGFLTESPFIALHPDSRPLQLTVVLGRLASRLMPKMHMFNKLDPNNISRNPEVPKQFNNDPLLHHTGTLEGLAGMLDRAAELEQGKVILPDGQGEGGKTRLWVGHGTADRICSYDACRKWYEGTKLEDKEMMVYEGWFHKLHTEPSEDAQKFASDSAKWMLDRCGPLSEMDAGSSKAKL